MALLRWDPFTALARVDDEFDNLVRRSFGAPREQFVPAVELATEGRDVLITLEVPGVDVENIDVEINGRTLTVSGERRERTDETQGKVLVRELRYGSFRRTFQLPRAVEAEQVEAEADNGLLRLRVRDVTPPAREPQKVAIRTQAPAIESTAAEE
ncbi:Hsp20/alpha crystallin family protein [Luedemannella helvata]|uniref:Hsp20/alpha crystallin family protein n=1 Tax=Luedemannella helvata TaxID=349315 RepID=A0ABP4WS31_9ACTN